MGISTKKSAAANDDLISHDGGTYVPGSLKINRTDDTMVAGGITHNIQRIDVTW